MAGKLGLSFFGLIHPSASAVWLPTGIAMAALLLFGFRLVPAVFVGAFFVNVTTAGSIPSSLGVALGNTLEAVLAVWLVDRFAGGRQAFATAAGILEFAALAAFASTMVSATIGVASLTLGGYVAAEDWREIWFTWWLGDAAGAVLITPLIVLWWTRPAWDRSPQKVQGAALLFTAIVAIGSRHVLSSRAGALSACRFSAWRRSSGARCGSGLARSRRPSRCSRSSRRRLR